MKVGDKVYITCDDHRQWKTGKICTVSKSGNKYFETVETGPWYKFVIDPAMEHCKNRSIEAKGSRRGEESGQFSWYPSKEAYDKMKWTSQCYHYVINNIGALATDDEIIDLYNILKEREGAK